MAKLIGHPFQWRHNTTWLVSPESFLPVGQPRTGVILLERRHLNSYVPKLIATVLMHGYKDELDLLEIAMSLELLCDFGIKPDLMGLCYAFLYPGIAEIVIPHCKNELNEILAKHPELLLVFIAGLLEAEDNDIKYFTGISDLWFHAVKSMKACGVNVPEKIEVIE